MTAGLDPSASRRPDGLSRRHFLRGLGACIALPAFASLGTPGCWPPDGGRRPGHDRLGRAAADGLRLLPQRRHPGHLVAERRGGRLPAQAGPSSRWSRSRAWSRSSAAWTIRRPKAGPDGAGDHARGNGTFLTGVRLKKSATDIQAGRLHRPGDGAAGRPPHAVPVAGAGVRLGAEGRGLRLGLFLRLPVQPLLELADDADAAGGQPAAGLRAALRRRARRASGGRTCNAAGTSSGPSSTSSSTTPARCSAGSGPRTEASSTST